jgi:hypothetical protein
MNRHATTLTCPDPHGRSRTPRDTNRTTENPTPDVTSTSFVSAQARSPQTAPKPNSRRTPPAGSLPRDRRPANDEPVGARSDTFASCDHPRIEDDRDRCDGIRVARSCMGVPASRLDVGVVGSWSRVEVEGGVQQGRGSVRVLVRAPFRVRERIVEWVPHERMAYELIDGMRVRGYRAAVMLEEAAEASSSSAGARPMSARARRPRIAPRRARRVQVAGEGCVRAGAHVRARWSAQFCRALVVSLPTLVF